MQEKLLFDLVEELAGETNGRIVQILFNKKNVNEFLIARKMELTINQVRNILYKLSNHGLVSFNRKKDNKKGWYIYFWTLNTEKSLKMIEDSLNRKAERLSEKLHKRETERFFICNVCDIEVTEAVALENGFSCEECAEVYELADNSKIIRETKAKITRTKNELEAIGGELKTIREKERKKRERINKKLEKEAAVEKERKRLIRKAERDKLKKTTAKKTVKKVTKKKVVKKTVKKVTKKAKKKAIKKKVVKKTVKKVTKKKVVKRGVRSLLKKVTKKRK
jgi:transcription initiation factor TFIIE subunit alpha